MTGGKAEQAIIRKRAKGLAKTEYDGSFPVWRNKLDFTIERYAGVLKAIECGGYKITGTFRWGRLWANNQSINPVMRLHIDSVGSMEHFIHCYLLNLCRQVSTIVADSGSSITILKIQ